MKTAFIGLGVMGYPMAGHLLKAGREVTVRESATDQNGARNVVSAGLAIPGVGAVFSEADQRPTGQRGRAGPRGSSQTDTEAGCRFCRHARHPHTAIPR